LHLNNSINWTPLYAAPVISAVSQPRRQGNEKMHMSIFKLIVDVIFNVAFFGVLTILPAGTLDWNPESGDTTPIFTLFS
jgi:trimethylamine:corrinoid methyltransferase-like protein